MRHALFPISLLLSSAACSSQADLARETGVKEDPAALTTARATAAARAEGVDFSDSAKEKGWERSFEYGWPAAVSTQPELAKLLTAERDKFLAQEKSEWADALKDSPTDCVSCGQRSFALEWKMVAETPDFLSLSGAVSTYTGGAHGLYGMRSLVWDKVRKLAVDGVGVFRSPEALEAALGPKLCAALNAEREKRRGQPVVPGSGGAGFDECQHVTDATVLVGSSNGKTFDRIGIWFGPYVAGPYAEGAYELTFPVDAKVRAAVKDEFAVAFGKQG